MSNLAPLPYRIIALDLDGTLTNSQKIITPRTFEALMSAQREGVRLVLASGRPTFGIASLANQLRLAEFGGFVLSYNGGRIIDWNNKTTIYSQTVPTDLIADLYRFAEEVKLPIVTYLPEAILASRNEGDFLEEEARINGMPIVVAKDFVAEASQIKGGSTKCPICGQPLYNKCPDLEHCRPLPGFARHCPICGKKTSYFSSELLSTWRIEKYNTDIEVTSFSKTINNAPVSVEWHYWVHQILPIKNLQLYTILKDSVATFEYGDLIIFTDEQSLPIEVIEESLFKYCDLEIITITIESGGFTYDF